MRVNCDGFKRSNLRVILIKSFQSEFGALCSDTEEGWWLMGLEGLAKTVSVPLTRQLFETAAADVLKRLKEV